MEVLLLGILSLALVGLVFGTDEDEQEVPDTTETGDDARAPVAFIAFDGGSDLMGTDGDGTISLAQPREALVPMNEATMAN